MTSTSKARQSPLMHFKLLRKLLHSSRSFRRYPQALCQEVFQKVERQFMLGLRAKDPDARRKFFSMYHESLNKTLFTRLHYIIQIQDWETLSDVFWLKQGLDLLLAILVEDKSITVAPNSTRVLPLVAPDSISDSSLMQHHIADVPEGSEEAPLTLDGLVLKNVQFQNEMSRLQKNKEFKKFKKQGCEDYELLGEIFNTTTATGKLQQLSTEDPLSPNEDRRLEEEFLYGSIHVDLDGNSSEGERSGKGKKHKIDSISGERRSSKVNKMNKIKVFLDKWRSTLSAKEEAAKVKSERYKLSIPDPYSIGICMELLEKMELEAEKDELFDEGERENEQEFDDTEASSSSSHEEHITFDMSQTAEMAQVRKEIATSSWINYR
ncbi:hypothetical protein V6N13_101601 [Hibiscus sabdariffa]